MTEIRTVIVACDGSEGALAAARYASEIATGLSTKLILIHVFPRTALDLIGMHGPTAAMVGIDPFEPDTFEKIGQESADQAFKLASEQLASGLKAERVRLAGDPSTEIVKFAASADNPLIIMGHRGLGRISGALMGSVSQRVMHHAPCPVMVIP